MVESLNLLGDRFCTEPWAGRAVRALRALGAQYRRGVPVEQGGTGTGAAREEVVQVDGVTMEGSGQELEQGQEPGRSRKIALASLRASLSSVLVVTHELLTDKGRPEVRHDS